MQRLALLCSVGIALLAASATSCQKPIEPPVGALPAADASSAVRTLQLDEERDGQEVRRIARAQAGRELGSVLRVARSPGLDGGTEPGDGGFIARAADAEVTGKLEGAKPTLLIIRDGTGFEYWLRTSDETQVTLNGRPARLTDFKQGADVRVSFVWQGNQRVATAVDVLHGESRDGGFAAVDVPDGPLRDGGVLQQQPGSQVRRRASAR